MKKLALASAAMTLLCAWSHSAIGAVVVDGALGDWGITLNGTQNIVFGGGVVNNAAQPGNFGAIGNFLGSGTTLYYHAEDSSDSAADSGLVGPYYGGQNYDAEFLGLIVQNGKLYIGMSTGQRPDNGQTKFGPGDLRITTSLGTFGIELGGKLGNTSDSNGAFALNSQGATFALDSSGHTMNATTYTTDRTAGSIWDANGAADWINDPISDGAANVHPVQLNHGSLPLTDKVGMTDAFTYNYASALGQHAFIELSLDLSVLLGNASQLTLDSVSWSPSCYNDELHVFFPPGMSYSAPEAASLAIWVGMGAIATLRCVRRKKSSG
ncbi:MAG: hypothetical protein IT427_02640 [Pirellulales bacterium]|nr:hypothetical protein [Pirellulales bacterium]